VRSRRRNVLRGHCLGHDKPVEARSQRENANTQTARFDFIPSSNAPTYLTQDSIVGALPPKDVDGVPVLGSYGKAWVLESLVIPQGYFAVVSSGGANSDRNPFALRQHANPAYQGLRAIPGPFQRTRSKKCSSLVVLVAAQGIAVLLHRAGEGYRQLRNSDDQPVRRWSTWH
jgi:hypothetical protein